MMDNRIAKTIFDKLIDDCLKNDRIAQKKLYELLYKPVYSLSLYMVKNTADAEDIMQETFISAFRSLAKYPRHVKFEYWLKRIAINKCIDFLRSRTNAVFTPDDRISEKLASDEFYIDTDTDKQTLMRKVKENILKLPDGYRIILTLYYFEGYDHQEISEILNIRESSSRSQLTRALAKLKSLIKY